MLRVLPANAALRNWKIGHIFFENKFLEAENEVQKNSCSNPASVRQS